MFRIFLKVQMSMILWEIFISPLKTKAKAIESLKKALALKKTDYTRA